MFNLRLWGSLPLEQRIAMAALSLTLATATAIGAVSYVTMRGMLQAEADQHGMAQARETAQRAGNQLRQLDRELALIAKNTITTNAMVDSAGRLSYLMPFLNQHWLRMELGAGLAVCDYRAQMVAQSDGVSGDCAVFQPRLTGLEAGQQQVVLDPASGVLHIAHPLWLPASGQVEGFVAARLPLREWFDAVSPPGLVDQQRYLVGRAYESLRGREGDTPRVDSPLYSSVLALPAHLAALDLKVTVPSNPEVIQAALRRLQQAYAIVAVVLFTLVYLLARVAGRRIANPLVVLEASARRLSQDVHAPMGDLSVNRGDEVGRLARAFEDMALKLSVSYRLLGLRVQQRTRELAESNERLNDVLDAVQDVIWSYSLAEQRWNYIGAASEQMFGRTPESLMAHADAWQAMIHADDLDYCRAEANKAIEQGSHTFECRGVRRDGAAFWMEARMRVLRAPDGTPRRLHGILLDIDAQRRAELQRDQQLLMLQGVFSMNPDGFVCFDGAGKLIEINPSCLDIVGARREDLVGTSRAQFEQLLRSQATDIKTLPCSDGDAQRQAGVSHMLELVHPSRRTLMCTERNTPGSHPLSILYFRDITEEIELGRMRSDFLSTAAHELRTPLASILGFSELLLRRQFDDATRLDMTRTVHAHAADLARIVDDLLDLSRIEAKGKLGFELQSHPIADLVSETARAMDIPGSLHTIGLDLDAVDGVQVRVDEARFRQALRNVLGNAIKYSPEGGDIRIALRTSARQGRGEVAVEVTDQGMGMSAESVEHAFERFFRADKSGSIPGTGLGLSLVQDIMAAHDGGVELRSAQGVGTSVTLWLPLAP